MSQVCIIRYLFEKSDTGKLAAFAVTKLAVDEAASDSEKRLATIQHFMYVQQCGVPRTLLSSSPRRAPRFPAPAMIVPVGRVSILFSTSCLLVSYNCNDMFLEHCLKRLSAAEVSMLLTMLVQLLKVHCRAVVKPTATFKDVPSKKSKPAVPSVSKKTPVPSYAQVRTVGVGVCASGVRVAPWLSLWTC